MKVIEDLFYDVFKELEYSKKRFLISFLFNEKVALIVYLVIIILAGYFDKMFGIIFVTIIIIFEMVLMWFIYRAYKNSLDITYKK